MFFLKRNRILLEKIQAYFEICNTGMKLFDQVMNYFLDHGNDTEFENHISHIREIEGKADAILHKIEKLLYKKSLLPESREDLMRLLERYDDIIDCTNHILRYLNTRNMLIPDFIKDDIREMVKTSLLCYDQVRLAIEDLLGKRQNIMNFVRTINDYESLCDEIQARIIKTIFLHDIDKFDKIILTELINIIAKLTDHCEDAADHITLINVKRVV